MLDNNHQSTSMERSGEDNPWLMLESMSLSNFRSYESFDLSNIGMLTLLVGPNAIGKTNLVEAISLMSALTSFRTTHADQMVAWGSDVASVTARFSGAGRHLEETLTIANGRRSYALNGKTKKIQDLKGLVPAVTFNPDDLNLAKGSHSVRRSALDAIGAQLSKNFYAVRNDYLKLMKQKNQALKDDASDAYIASIEEVMVKVGVQLMSHRRYVAEKLKPLMEEHYRDITGSKEKLNLVYVPFYDRSSAPALLSANGYEQNVSREIVSAAFFSKLEEYRVAERARGRCLIGPQSDEVYFAIDSRDSVNYASQGQQRSIVLSYKLSELSLVLDMLGQKPLLILDDVMSELDARRRDAFMSYISEDIQTFITTTHLDYFSPATLDTADVRMLGK